MISGGSVMVIPRCSAVYRETSGVFVYTVSGGADTTLTNVARLQTTGDNVIDVTVTCAAAADTDDESANLDKAQLRTSRIVGADIGCRDLRCCDLGYRCGIPGRDAGQRVGLRHHVELCGPAASKRPRGPRLFCPRLCG